MLTLLFTFGRFPGSGLRLEQRSGQDQVQRRRYLEGQRVAGDGVHPLYQPMLSDDGEQVVGLMGLITQRVFDYSASYPPAVGEPDAEHLPVIAEARNALIEDIIAESEDESLMDRYLSGEEIDTSTIIADLEKAVARGSFYPVVPVCAQTRVGLDSLLELLTGAFPSPLEHPLPPVSGVDGSPRAPLTCDPTGPLVDLADRGKHKPNELSGGQQQRVAIARALVADPTLLVCDEPTGDLDRRSAEEIMNLLQALNRTQGKTIVMVTHDPKAAEYASRELHLDKGRLVDEAARRAA